MSMMRLNGIALVQIISALLIVNYHTDTLDIPVLSQVAKFGFIFNTVFVFLSGFLLARSLSTITYKEFLYKRLNRVYPSFHIALLLITFIYLFTGQEFRISSLILAFTGLAYYFGDNTFGIHLWFVSVIIGCYLLCIPTYHALKRHPLIFFTFLLIFTLIIIFVFEKSINGIYGKVNSVIGYKFLYHYIVFSLALYIGIQKEEIASQANPWKLLGTFIFALSLYIGTYNQTYFGLMTIVADIVVAFCIIQIILMISPFAEKHFSYVFFLSTITFEIYLIHLPIINVIDGSYHGQYIAYPLVFLFSISFAFLILMISKQYERLLKRFILIWK